jgi:predicted nucleotidyltransferase
MDKIKNLVTIRHGSHLYNLARPNSDLDLYTVYTFLNRRYRPKKQVVQEIEGETDSVKISDVKFTEQIHKGVPQALEALFAEKEFWLDADPNWEDLRLHYRDQINIYTVLDTYKRTIRNFFELDDIKKNRHGFRLLLNADSMIQDGYFNPTLSDDMTAEITKWANQSYEKRLETYHDLLWRVFR